jgi:hypothetical protein
MMQLSPEMIIGIAVVLVGCISVLGGCIAVLWRQQVKSNQRCETEGAQCRKKQADLDEFIRTTLLDTVQAAAGREAANTSELARARQIIERVEKRFPADKDQTPLQPARTHG